MNKGRFFFISTIIFCFILTSSLFGENIIGEIVYLEGYVDITRDGELLDWRNVDIGTEINDYDLIETGDDGIAEISLNTPARGGTTVRVSEDTAFYFNVSTIDNKKQTTFEMLTGSLALKVQRLAGNEAVSVKTESAAMGVRGTEFDVTTSSDGAILITCVEGSVFCEDEEGGSSYAKAGSVVQQNPDEGVKAYNISVEDIALYKSFWQKTRDEIFKAGAPVFIKTYGERYLDYLPIFEEAYESLLEQAVTIKQYGKNGADYSLGTLLQKKGEVSPAVFKMRSILMMFEHVFYRLQDLSEHHSLGIGHCNITRRITSTQLFDSFEAEKDQIKRKMGAARHLFKLYVELTRATGDDTGLIDDIFSSGNPLEGGGVPSGDVPTGGF